MAVMLRMARFGSKGRPFYRIVATEKTSKRDGKFMDIVGTLNPMTDPPVLSINHDKVTRWINNGAKASGRVRDILSKELPQLLSEREQHQRAKIQARRKARKARIAKSAK
ncbi:MAG: 30S ribosomal protein S16 [Bdellovibrionales bacterium]|nr:30S ribosomal protein S16 [Bdellovibrionales bacterium]